mmetsp:Transcript_17779/g.36926  ORF Transcript_17779/g.36926 Transcript_17779/m.36926 type:complete len:202 (+) Transcript_17779:1413-2018(+)
MSGDISFERCHFSLDACGGIIIMMDVEAKEAAMAAIILAVAADVAADAVVASLFADWIKVDDRSHNRHGDGKALSGGSRGDASDDFTVILKGPSAGYLAPRDKPSARSSVRKGKMGRDTDAPDIFVWNNLEDTAGGLVGVPDESGGQAKDGRVGGTIEEGPQVRRWIGRHHGRRLFFMPFCVDFQWRKFSYSFFFVCFCKY